MSGLLGLLSGYAGRSRVFPSLVERLATPTPSSADRVLEFTESVLDGDMIVVGWRLHSNLTVVSVPSGFVQRHISGVNDPSVALYTKLAGASEPADYTFTASGVTTGHRLHGYLVRGSSLTVGSVEGNDGTGTESLALADTPIDANSGSILIGFIGGFAARTIAFDNSFDRLHTDSQGANSAYREYSAAAAAQNTTATWTSVTTARSALIEIG